MKKVVLIISSRYQPNACGFIREFEKLKGKIDSILCLEAKKDFKHYMKKPLRIFKKLKPSGIKAAIVRGMSKSANMQHISALKDSWNNAGENSWDLLKDRFDIFAYAEEKKIPFRFASALTTEIIEQYISESPTIFPMYGGGYIPDKIIKNERAEFINAHMGEMPRYRGMNVIEWAVLEDQPPKVAVMVMNEKIDGGDVIWHKNITLSNELTIPELRKTGFVFCYHAMAEAIFNYLQDPSLRKPQPKGARFYYRMHGRIRKMLQDKLTNNTGLR